MKKILVVLTLVGIMFGSLGMGAFSTNASSYPDFGESLPAEPAQIIQ